jgi:hypothetical protein
MKATTYKALENHPLVDEIIREYEEGEGYSYWLYLKSGYKFDKLGTTAIHQLTKKCLIQIFNSYQIVKDI